MKTRLTLLFTALLSFGVYLNAQQTATPQTTAPGAAAPAPAASPLDFEYFKVRVQPIFLKKKPGIARCVVCHENGTPRLQMLAEGATTWTEEQSRQNFNAWQRVVVFGNPMGSRLLTHPLAEEAGGDHFHGGGRHWASQTDPDFQTIAEWIKGAKLPAGSR
jgi:hypothetical protein